MQPHPSLAVRNRHSGFSLIELAICIMVMGIIVVASVRILDRVEDAKVKSAAQTARRINEIASIVYETTGAWPSNTNQGRLPPEMEPYLSNNILGNTTPLGGIWHWNGPSGSISESAGIAIRFESDSDLNKGLLSQLDRLIDNGDLSSGACWITSDSGAYCYVMAADATPETTPTPTRFVSPVRMGIQEATISEEAIFSPSFAEPVRPEVPSAL
jgi:prepilin-type N-terminal cleavage/methylation domain-containing protein